MKKIGKRHIAVLMIVVFVCVLIWRVSTSYAFVDIGYSGRNIISGDKWGVNIVEVGEVELVGDALLTKEVSTIGTTLNFDVALFKPGDKVSFDITVENTGNLKAELYALTLQGLSNIDSEVITYTILPVDYVMLHEDGKEGSIIKRGEKQMFKLTVSYDENVSLSNDKEFNLSLGSTIIYKQR